MEREPCYTVCVSVDVCKREREIDRQRAMEREGQRISGKYLYLFSPHGIRRSVFEYTSRLQVSHMVYVSSCQLLCGGLRLFVHVNSCSQVLCIHVAACYGNNTTSVLSCVLTSKFENRHDQKCHFSH